MDNIIKALTKPEKLYSYSQVHDIPETSGIYAWYFKENSLPVPTGKFLMEKDKTPCHLLYVGETTNLHNRIKGHYRHQSNSSTLRRSLGVLFLKDTGGFVYKVRSNKKRYYHFSKDGEMWLKNWMMNNAFVCWVKHTGNLKEIENELMKEALPPLNIKGGTHPFSCKLGGIRCLAKLKAIKAE